MTVSPGRACAFLLAFLPALAVVPGTASAGSPTLYREPKMVVFTVGFWLLAATLAASSAGPRVARAAARVVAESWPARLVLLFVAYMATSALWGRVAANALYELRTLVLAAALMVTVAAWQRVDPRAAGAVRWGLVVSLGTVTAIGAVQSVVDLPFLPPILPELGARHPSTFGFKNPAALAVLGQWFLLLHLAWCAERRALRVAAACLLGVEALYLVSLHSRTALLGLAAGLAFAGLGLLARRRPVAIRGRTLAFALGGALALVLTVVAVDSWRGRALEGLRYVADPAAYLESDRGIYLRNTLAMVEAHPFGVGLGDWQTFYGVFRRHQRDLAFDRTIEVRRAHSDHVQFLGEGGWPGLALWWTALGSVLVSGLLAWRRSGDPWPLLATAQVAAFAAAMATDYVVEMPYHRFLFFLVLALALDSHRRGLEGVGEDPGPEHDPEQVTDPEPDFALPRRRPVQLVLAALLGAVAVTEAIHGGLLLERQRAAGSMSRAYLEGIEDPGPRRQVFLQLALDAGRRFARLPGYTKTTPRDERVLAHLLWLAGEGEEARSWLEQSLAHQPYSPPGLDLAAAMLQDSHPEASFRFAEAARHIDWHAVRGFEWPYPRWPEEP